MNDKARHDMSLFPRPAMQTGLKDKDGNNINTRISITPTAVRPQATSTDEESASPECTSDGSDSVEAPSPFFTASSLITTEITFTVTDETTTWTTAMTEVIDPMASVTTMFGAHETITDDLSSSFDWSSLFSALSEMFSTMSEFEPSLSSWETWYTSQTSGTTNVASPVSVSGSIVSWGPASSTGYYSSDGLTFSESYTESYTDGSESAPTATVITIPIETGETVIVQMHTTTYTIVDGTTRTYDAGSITSDYSGTRGRGTPRGRRLPRVRALLRSMATSPKCRGILSCWSARRQR
ncbi:hypothetical protein B0T16DRAFT_410434 [Cercophora newfieldiana]|uniref:Uncharacterized protein n=1 Tax=Cercophora newfieldiana TaxID=92897 RepID=A0AA40CUM2_9PEZI|nr:hypothetical protein B0T16DRAFT_410434 [Cercophora newfieldiana]